MNPASRINCEKPLVVHEILSRHELTHEFTLAVDGEANPQPIPSPTRRGNNSRQKRLKDTIFYPRPLGPFREGEGVRVNDTFID